jgi:hypothetical protein
MIMNCLERISNPVADSAGGMGARVPIPSNSAPKIIKAVLTKIRSRSRFHD